MGTYDDSRGSPLSPPDPKPYADVREWWEDTGDEIEIEYMGLTLRVWWRRYPRARWAPPDADRVKEAKAILTYIAFLGSRADLILEAIADGQAISGLDDFAELLPPEEVSAIVECALAKAAKTGEWKD